MLSAKNVIPEEMIGVIHLDCTSTAGSEKDQELDAPSSGP